MKLRRGFQTRLDVLNAVKVRNGSSATPGPASRGKAASRQAQAISRSLSSDSQQDDIIDPRNSRSLEALIAARARGKKVSVPRRVWLRTVVNQRRGP